MITAGIIAGGRSRRFGSPKALAEFRGERLIDLALRCAAGIAPQTLVSCGPVPLALPGHIRQFPDTLPGCGALGGIATLMRHCSTPWLAILPCDMPLLHSIVYEVLLADKKAGRPVVARSAAGVEPLVSIWPVRLLAQLQEALQAQQLAVQAFLQSAAALEVDIAEALGTVAYRMLANVNRREDLLELETRSV